MFLISLTITKRCALQIIICFVAVPRAPSPLVIYTTCMHHYCFDSVSSLSVVEIDPTDIWEFSMCGCRSIFSMCTSSEILSAASKIFIMLVRRLSWSENLLESRMSLWYRWGENGENGSDEIEIFGPAWWSSAFAAFCDRRRPIDSACTNVSWSPSSIRYVGLRWDVPRNWQEGGVIGEKLLLLSMVMPLR